MVGAVCCAETEMEVKCARGMPATLLFALEVVGIVAGVEAAASASVSECGKVVAAS